MISLSPSVDRSSSWLVYNLLPISVLICSFAIVHPVEDHTKLTLDKEGLDRLKSITGPVAPVVIIGPYRSGKSFTLNQLLSVGCTEGFGVGHERVTQTKGVWFWGDPVPVKMEDGSTLNVRSGYPVLYYHHDMSYLQWCILRRTSVH